MLDKQSQLACIRRNNDYLCDNHAVKDSVTAHKISKLSVSIKKINRFKGSWNTAAHLKRNVLPHEYVQILYFWAYQTINKITSNREIP